MTANLSKTKSYLGIFAEAYSLTQNSLYADRVTKTISWLGSEMLGPDGGFYSALDADSEGIEGRFYIWKKAELQSILGDDFDWFSKLYNISAHGNWEDGYNHLHLTNYVSETAKAAGIYCVGYMSENSKLQELAEADKVVNHFNELNAEIIKNLK